MIHPSSKSKPPAQAKKTSKIVQDAVSGQLKAYFDDMTHQEIPDRFLELLKQLDENEIENQS